MPQSIRSNRIARKIPMIKRFTITAIAALLVLAALTFFAYEKWGRDGNSDRVAMLAAMPSTASTIFFADLAELRQSSFTTQVYSWAPKPQIDADYAQFLGDTGFDYERDLDRVAIAAIKHAQETEFFVIADGRFDRKKIVVYASQSGTHDKGAGHEIFSVPKGVPQPTASATANTNSVPGANANSRKISFTFLSNTRMALTTSSDLAARLSVPTAGQDAKDWRERFARLAGSPIFAVIRQDAAPGAALAARTPGGLQSPQLSSLLDQLQWITIAGKPEGDHLRVVTEGESSRVDSARQLADMLNGILLLAQAGLNGPQIRAQLSPQSREAYLEILKTADVSRIDRGETKSVRLVFDVTANFLAAARTTLPAIPTHADPRKSPRK
jgi:hypothetical protein